MKEKRKNFSCVCVCVGGVRGGGGRSIMEKINFVILIVWWINIAENDLHFYRLRQHMTLSIFLIHRKMITRLNLISYSEIFSSLSFKFLRYRATSLMYTKNPRICLTLFSFTFFLYQLISIFTFTCNIFSFGVVLRARLDFL